VIVMHDADSVGWRLPGKPLQEMVSMSPDILPTSMSMGDQH
jgi:hypothetical protein